MHAVRRQLPAGGLLWQRWMDVKWQSKRLCMHSCAHWKWSVWFSYAKATSRDGGNNCGLWLGWPCVVMAVNTLPSLMWWFWLSFCSSVSAGWERRGYSKHGVKFYCKKQNIFGGKILQDQNWNSLRNNLSHETRIKAPRCALIPLCGHDVRFQAGIYSNLENISLSTVVEKFVGI